MMLEVTIGESITVRFDDDNVSITNLIPEQFEEYLVRMRRQSRPVLHGPTQPKHGGPH